MWRHWICFGIRLNSISIVCWIRVDNSVLCKSSESPHGRYLYNQIICLPSSIYFNPPGIVSSLWARLSKTPLSMVCMGIGISKTYSHLKGLNRKMSYLKSFLFWRHGTHIILNITYRLYPTFDCINMTQNQCYIAYIWCRSVEVYKIMA